MFPKIGPQNTGSAKAEPDIYWRLEKQLSDDFTVIHSLPWLASVAKEIDDRPVPTGEIDFLILHKDLGILAVEVKGGIFTHDRTEFVYKRTGEKIDPIRQVRRGVHALSRWLCESGAGKWRIGYCIIFPHSEFREAIPIALIDRTVKPAKPIALDIRHLSSLGDHLQEIMRYWKRSLDIWKVNEREIENLIDIILPSSDYTPCWQTRFEYDAITWLRLTPEQVTCLQRIEEENRLVITGYPGTGKTLLLIEYARRLSKRGQKILIISYNALLTEYLKDELAELSPSIEVVTFHEQCRRASRIIKSPVSSDKQWYSIDGPEALRKAVSINQLPSYDALLIDEGQALHANWLEILDTWFGNKKIIVFCDATQSFRFENSTSPENISNVINAKKPYSLTINLRSPKTVFERISRVYSAAQQQFCPRPLESDTLSELVVENPDETLQDVINQLDEEGIPKKSIIIINANPGWIYEQNYQGIDVISAVRFRGLESPVVIVWAGDGSDEAALFCAYTRATSRCIAIYDAVAMIKGKYETFGQLILREDKAGKIEEIASRSTISSIFRTQEFSLTCVADETIDLHWCTDWKGWVIFPENSDRVSRLMWTCHLISTTNYPVYYWDSDARMHLEYFRPVNRLEEKSGQSCGLEFCNTCSMLTPFISSEASLTKDQCLICLGASQPEFDDIYMHTEFDRILKKGSQSSISDKKRLSIFLMALGRWNTLPVEIRYQFSDEIVASYGSVAYYAACLLVFTDIVKVPEKTFSLKDIAAKYRQIWCPDLEKRIDEKTWCAIVSLGINKWISQKLLRKQERGIYERVIEFAVQ